MSHVMNTYARQPVAFVRGQGVWLYDESGKKYLDALSGIAVNTLGHNHPRLVRALTEQIGRLMHSSNLFQMPLQEQAADRIAAISGLDEVFFCNSGLEAGEATIKVARKYGHDRGIAEPAIIVMEKAFHGRSLATLSATASRKVQAGFEPETDHLPGCDAVGILLAGDVREGAPRRAAAAIEDGNAAAASALKQLAQ